MKNMEFMHKVTGLLDIHGKPLTRANYPTDYMRYVEHAQEAGSHANLRQVPILGRIAVHNLVLDHITIRTSLSILGEAAGVMPQDLHGQLLGSFDVMTLDKVRGYDLLSLKGDMYTSGTVAWIDTSLDIDDMAGTAIEQETLEFFKGFSRPLFNRGERHGDAEDILSAEDIGAVSAHFDRTIGTMPLSDK